MQVCTLLQTDNHASTPLLGQLSQHPTTQFFTGWMPFLPPNQQRQSTEGTDEKQKVTNTQIISSCADVHRSVTWIDANQRGSR